MSSHEVFREDRLDAEYWRKEFVAVIRTLDSIPNVKLLSDKLITKRIIKSMILGSRFEAYTKNREDGIPFVRVADFNDVFLNIEKVEFMRKSTQLKGLQKGYPGYIVVSKSGTLGNVGILPEDFNEYFLSDDLIALELNSKVVNPYYLLAFLLSKYGQSQLIRGKTQQVQKKLPISSLVKLKVPMPPREFQDEIENLIKKAYNERKRAFELYKQAENELYSLLGINSLQIPTDTTNVTMSPRRLDFRLDAEYYMKKYLYILSVMKNKTMLKDVVEISEDKIDVENPHQRARVYKYVALADIDGSFGIISQWQTLRGWELPTRARMRIRKGDVLVSSLKGSLDKIAIVPPELDNEVASTGFFVLKPTKEYPSEILWLLFRTPLLSLQLERLARGAILESVSKKDFGEIYIPVLNSDTKHIQELVNASHKAYVKSKELLDQAKRKVEEWIEHEAQRGI